MGIAKKICKIERQLADRPAPSRSWHAYRQMPGRSKHDQILDQMAFDSEMRQLGHLDTGSNCGVGHSVRDELEKKLRKLKRKVA